MAQDVAGYIGTAGGVQSHNDSAKIAISEAFIDLAKNWASSFNLKVDADVSPYAANNCEAYKTERKWPGKNHCISIHHTLTYPLELPEVRFYAENRPSNAVLRVDLVKEGQTYFRKEISEPQEREIIKVHLPAQHPVGVFEAIISLSNRNGGKNIVDETKALYIQDAKSSRELLFFSFSTPKYSEWAHHHFQVIDNTPFSGIAVPLIRAFETDTVQFQDYRHVIALSHQITPKVWPLLFINRFIGSPESSSFNRRSGYWNRRDFGNTQFAKIKLVDIDNRTGALGEFYHLLTVATQISSTAGSPGIFIDMETYNCRNSIKISDLTQAYQTSAREIIRKLTEIGYQMADIIHNSYPECTVVVYHAGFDWIYRKGIARKDAAYLLSRKQSDFFHSTSYILLGMLERASSRQYEIRIVDGDIGGYLYPNMEFCKKRILMDHLLANFCKERYPNHYFFGTTIAPYENYAALGKDNWMRKSLYAFEKNGELDIKQIGDFEALLKYLLRCSEYTWVYGASAAGDKGGFGLFLDSRHSKYLPVLERALK